MRLSRVAVAATQGAPKGAPSAQTAKKKTPSVLRVATGVVVSKPAQTTQPARHSTRAPRKQDSSSTSGTQQPAESSSTGPARCSSTGAASSWQQQQQPPPQQQQQQQRPKTSSSKPATPAAPQPSSSALNNLAAAQLKALTDVPSVDLPVLPLTWVEFQKATSKAAQPSAKAARQRSSTASKPLRTAASSASATGGFGYIGKASALRLFRYAVEREPLERALQAAGLEDEVELVEEISLADAVVAVKATKSGKHVNIGQGERTAINAGIPFIMLGRKVSPESLSSALRPIIKRRAKRQAQDPE